MIKLGLIGLGRWGKNYIKTIEGMEDVQITEIVTSNEENLKLINNKVTRRPSFKEMCASHYLGGIIICSPPDTHVEIIHECFLNSMPFLVEKPMSLSHADALVIQNNAKKTKLACMVGHTQLYNPAFETLGVRTRNESIKSIKAEIRSYGPFRKDVNMLWDWLPHDLAMSMALLRDIPYTVKATLTSHENYDNSGELAVELYFKDTKVEININNLAANKYRALIVKAKSVQFTMFGEELYELRQERFSNINVSNEKPLKRVVDEFVNVIETNRQLGIDIAVYSSKIIEKCEESIKNNSDLLPL